jgi:hypothetical protein
MTKLSFEEWKNSDEMSYDLSDKNYKLIISNGWTTHCIKTIPENKSIEEVKNIELEILYALYLKEND